MSFTQAKGLQFCRFTVLLIAVPVLCFAQKDPGVRPGPPGAGTMLKGLSPIEQAMFNEGLNRALQLEAVCDECSDITLGSHDGSGERKSGDADEFVGTGSAV